MQSFELLSPLIDRSTKVSENEMYKTTDYLRNGVLYLNNLLRPQHKKLSTLMIYSTTKCQSRCKHCSIWQKPEEHLSLRDIQKIMASRCVTKNTMRVLKKELKKSKASACYNLKYLTGAYPEGDALLNLFIHPLDCMTYLFGEAQVKYAESVGCHTLMLILEHRCATGMLELSTGYSWNDAKEHWTINTVRGIYEIDQFDSLTFQPKPQIIMGIPMEKVFPCGKTTVSLLERNNFVPLQENNQIVSQGYYDSIKGFIDAVEGKNMRVLSSLEHLTHTYSLIENIRTLI